jgi:hypothetical protein
VDRVLALDRGYGDAYTTLGMLDATFDWNWSGAARAFQTALALCPGSSRAHYFHAASYLFPTGRSEQGLSEMLTAASARSRRQRERKVDFAESQQNQSALSRLLRRLQEPARLVTPSEPAFAR